MTEQKTERYYAACWQPRWSSLPASSTNIQAILEEAAQAEDDEISQTQSPFLEQNEVDDDEEINSQPDLPGKCDPRLMERLEMQSETLEKDMKEKSLRIKNLKTDIDRLELDDLEEREVLLRRLSNMRSEMEMMRKKQNALLMKQTEQMEKQNEQLELQAKEIEKLDSEKADLAKKAKAHGKKLSDAQKVMEEKKEQNQTLQQELQEVSNALEKSKVSEGTVQRELRKLHDALKVQNAQQADLEKRYDETVANLRHLEEEKEKQSQKLSNCQVRVFELPAHQEPLGVLSLIAGNELLEQLEIADQDSAGACG